MTDTWHITDPPEGLHWRRSTQSPSDTCVEVAGLPDGRVAVRNSNHPDAGALAFTHDEFTAWVQGAKAGEFDHLS